jgi:hypothetical protein
MTRLKDARTSLAHLQEMKGWGPKIGNQLEPDAAEALYYAQYSCKFWKMEW